MNITRVTMLCVCLFIVLGTLCAQPKLVVLTEVDWGKVIPTGSATAQQSVRTKLLLKNIGSEVLRIRETRPSCGCVTTQLEADSIEVAGEVYLNVAMSMPVANGPLHKTLTIRTNEPSDSMHIVVLKAELVRPIQLSSGFIPFNTGTVGNPASGEITITSFAQADILVSVAEIGDSVVVLSQNPFTIAQGTSEIIRLEYKPAVPGSYRVDLHLRTSLPGYESIPISGFGVATPKLER